MKRAALVLYMAGLAACGNGGAAGDGAASGSSAATAVARGPALPRVDDPARVMAMTNAKPGALVWIDGTGKLAVEAAGPDWSGDLSGKHRAPVAQITQLRDTLLVAMSTTKGPIADAARDELETGRADRPYRMHPDSPDAQLARQQAIDQARAAGILGSTAVVGGSDPDVPAPGRLHASRGMPIDGIAQTAPLVLAEPTSPANAIVDVVHRTGGAIGVAHHGKLAALAVGFEDGHDPRARAHGSGTWLEIQVDSDGTHITVQPDDTDTAVAHAGGRVDIDGVRKAYRAVRYTASRRESNVDVLVSPGMKAQDLVDVLVALHGAEALHVSLALFTGDRAYRKTLIEQARRAPASTAGWGVGPGGSSTTAVTLGVPAAQGDLDKAIIRRYVKRNINKIRFCYEKQLLVDDKLAGTVTAQFFIRPDGLVAQSEASGMDPTVAQCVAKVIEAIEFPEPKGGGGVQVSYPFTFRPAP